jgi:SCY1-like protein 2
MHILYEEIVESLEETRNELIFATEPILSSLQLSIPGSSRYSPLVELDEIEVCCTDIVLFYSILCLCIEQIQKGILQLCKGLEFLHSSARLIHSNLNPETVIINSAVSLWECEAYAELNLVVNREIGKFLGWAKPFP